jgi:hypothetical protein
MASTPDISRISLESQVLAAIDAQVKAIVAEEIEAAQIRVKERIWLAVAMGSIGIAEHYSLEMMGHQMRIIVDMKGLAPK